MPRLILNPPKKQTYRRQANLPGVALLMLILIAVVFIRPALAGPITGGSNNPPYAKVSVYQGIAVIAPGGTGSGVMELGNAGRDIASTGTIYFRPWTLTAANAVTIFKDGFNSNKTSVDINGVLCLPIGGCKDYWPVVPVSGSLWAQTSYHVQPTTLTRRVSFGRADPLQIFYNGNTATDAALYARNLNDSGYAAGFEAGDMHITNELNVVDKSPITGQITVREQLPECTDCQVWYAGNDGKTADGSGMDADLLDGINLSPLVLGTRDPNGGGECSHSGGLYCLYKYQGYSGSEYFELSGPIGLYDYKP